MKTILHSRAAVLLAAIMISPLFSSAQEVTEEWVAPYDLGAGRIDIPFAIAVDDEGYSYVTGESNSVSTNIDYYTIKYDQDGDAVEFHRYDGGINNDDRATDIAVDGLGNVYVTGESVGSGTSWDLVTIKYDSNLDIIWTRRYEGGINNEDRSPSLAIDDMGNVYVTCPSIGSGTSWDYATLKYDTDGNELWDVRYTSNINNLDLPTDIGVDSQGNVYVTGQSVGNGWDYLTVKYDSEGDYQWEERYNNSNQDDEATALVIDSSDNVIVTGRSVGSGSSWDYCTIKYAPNGGTEWTQRYNGPPGNNQDQAFAIGVDGSDNVYVTGASVSNDTSWDYATVKYEPVDGDQQWVSRYDSGINNEDWATALAVDVLGNIYVTGRSVGNGTSWDYATIKYEPIDGDEEWVQRFDSDDLPGAIQDQAEALAVDASGNVYVTGQSARPNNNWDYVTIRYSQPTIISVETIDTAAAFNVFPNPNSGNCTISLGKIYSEVEIRVMNYLGMEVERSTHFNENQIEMNFNYPAGIYFIEVITDSKTTLKVVKN